MKNLDEEKEKIETVEISRIVREDDAYKVYLVDGRSFLLERVNAQPKYLILVNGHPVVTCTEEYSPVPNSEFFPVVEEKVEKILGEKVAGEQLKWSLGWRKSIFYNIYRDYDVIGEKFNIGLLAENSYDLSRTLSIRLFGFRSICKNGMIFGRKDLMSVSRRHIGDLDVRKLVDDAFDNLPKAIEQIPVTIKAMRSHKVDSEQVEDLLLALRVRKRELARMNIYNLDIEHLGIGFNWLGGEDRVEVKGGPVTAWGLYNMITYAARTARPKRSEELIQKGFELVSATVE